MLRARAARVRDDAGNTMIIVIIVSMLVGSLASLALGTGRQAEWSSASDRNHEGSLGLAEAGVQEQIKRIQQQTGAGSVPTFVALDGTTPQGSYHVETARCPADVTDVSR
jgi:Tfp pilus assembly protein PilX